MNAHWHRLDSKKWELLGTALAKNTINTYKSSIRQYLRFCQTVGVSPLPLTEPNLENFCTYLLPLVGHGSMETYLNGVQCWSKMNGFKEEKKFMERLKYVLMGIQRVQGQTHVRPLRPPITWVRLNSIMAFIRYTESGYMQRLLSAVVLVGFFGMLRVSEFTSPSPFYFNHAIHLTAKDVHIDFNRNLALVFIKYSKTDQFGVGTTVRIARLNHPLCPVLALHSYLQLRGTQEGPLFLFPDGFYFTRSDLCRLLSRALPLVPHVNTHSLRRGGASALAAAGVSHEIIKALGRWKSDAYKRYIELSDFSVINSFNSAPEVRQGRETGNR